LLKEKLEQNEWLKQKLTVELEEKLTENNIEI
jgi:hypothetical protein